MSYYPDADEIRMAYVSHNKSDAYGSDAETLEVKFNRWFEYEQSKVVLATEERIIKLLIELNAIRRDALGHLVAFDTDGLQVIYLDGLENK